MDAQHRRETLKSRESERTRLAVVTWLCGKRKAAIEILKTECDAILTGKTGYLTESHGADEGAYLFYFGASAKDDEAKKYACAYLEKVSEKRFFMGNSWPPRFHDYLRNRLSDAGMQKIVSRTRDEKDQVVIFNRTPEETERVRALWAASVAWVLKAEPRLCRRRRQADYRSLASPYGFGFERPPARVGCSAPQKSQA
jgi:hypothetical protein